MEVKEFYEKAVMRIRTIIGSNKNNYATEILHQLYNEHLRELDGMEIK